MSFWSSSHHSRNGEATFDALDAGEYEVSVTDLVGCEEPDPQTVRVTVGKTTEVVFELVSKR